MKHIKWLLLALGLLGVATWLMRSGEPLDTGPRPRTRDVRMPRRASKSELDRAKARRTLPPRPFPTEDVAHHEVQDPVLRALPPRSEGDLAVVVEVNAIRHSPAAEMLLRCMDAEDKARLDEIRSSFGIDPLQDLDRFVFGPDGTTIVSGDFANLDLDAVQPNKPNPTRASYGDHGTILGRGDEKVAATWRDEIVLLADSLEDAQAAIDRLEGRAPITEPALRESMTYGEAYGYVSPSLLADMLPERDGLREKILAAASEVELHLDTRSDVGVVVDVKGQDPAALEELGVMIGAALSVSRIQARATEEKEFAELLDMAKVIPDHGSFRLEMAVPLDYLAKNLGECSVASNDTPR